MKEEALKLADDLWKKYLDNNECQHGYALSSGCPNDDCQEQSLYEASAMIRRLVEELDKLIHDNEELLRCLTAEQEHNEMLQTKPLSDEEIWDLFQKTQHNAMDFARAIEERHGIK